MKSYTIYVEFMLLPRLTLNSLKKIQTKLGEHS